MTDESELTQLPANFSGNVRLFPLPNLVMFPHVAQPLHIFEPRYQALLAEAMADDQLISMALLQPGWQSNYEARPAIEPVVCIGRVVAQAPASNGHDILLVGIARARVVRELPPRAMYREAEVALLWDHDAPLDLAARARLQERLIGLFRGFVPESPLVREHLEQLLARPLPLGMLTDVVAFTLAFDLPFKQSLLAEIDVDRRARRLIAQLEKLAAPAGAANSGPFPPEFSAN